MNPQIIVAVVSLNLFTLGVAFGKTAKHAKSKAKLVTFDSACQCHGNHGVDRWTPKTDTAPPPPFGIGVPTLTPSQIYAWKGPGPNVPLTKKTETRLPAEQKWYKLHGRVVDIRVEADGDIHVMLRDATGNQIGTVGAEIP